MMTTRKRSVRDLHVKGKRVFVRVDFNVPLTNGAVSDDTRIRASLPTLKLILDGGGSAIIASHLGRPKGRVVPEMSLKPAGERLEALLGRKVLVAPDCVGGATEEMTRRLGPGEALLLENLRFHPEEEKNDVEFGRRLARLADLYVNDAFGAAHRAHASVVEVPAQLPDPAAGLLMQSEVLALTRLRDHPEKPYVAVLGGAKVSDKLDLIHNLLTRVDAILIGGAMAYTFLKARGIPVGSSKVEADRIEGAADIISRAMNTGVRLHLPIDHIVAQSPEPGRPHRQTETALIDDGWCGFDIGPRSREAYAEEVRAAATIFWNGPLGMCEVEPYDAGTSAMARAIAGVRAFSVVGGGDSVAAVNRLGLAPRFSHISTGGGASLEFLSGLDLPGLHALSDVTESAPGRVR